MSGEIKNLGGWAEKHFDSLCSAAGITSNKSGEDRTGWDFILEFPQRKLPKLPPDLQGVERTARAQVKSKARGRPLAKLRLGNAHRFAAAPEPCFVILMVASNGRHPVRIFAKHFWRGEIARTLKRLREADHSATPVNRQTVSIAFDGSDEHTDDLLSWMAGTIEVGGPNYAAEKRRLNERLGYEESQFVGSISLLYSDMGKLVDHSIGLDVQLDLTNVRLVDRRFGIEARTPLVDAKPYKFHMQSHPQACAIEITDNEDRVLRFDGDLYLPGIPGLPLEMMKARAVAGPLEAIVRGTGEATVNYHFSGSDVHELSDLARRVALMAAFGKGPVQVSIHFGGRRLEASNIETAPVEDAAFFHDAALLLEALCIVARKATGPEPAISLEHFVEVFHEVQSLRELVLADSLTLALDANDEKVASAKVERLVLSGTLEVGGWRFSTVVAYRLRDDEFDAGERKVSFERPTIMSAIVDQRDFAAHNEEMGQELKRYAERHGAGVLTIAKGSEGVSQVVFVS